MLYPNSKKPFSMELFANPTSEYRGTPFWAWNCALNQDLLRRQISYLKEMGFGGFHMHSRSGMSTEYLSDDFMELIRYCTDVAQEEGMLAWLYDEDRWPSGSAGGFVTRDLEMRQRKLVVTREKKADASGCCLLACYDICLNQKGELESGVMIGEGDAAQGEKWYAYACTATPSNWFNGQTYIDSLNKEAVERFVKLTHERYKEVVGDRFGTLVPAIFTDEPAYTEIKYLQESKGGGEAVLPWSPDLAETYRAATGLDLLEHVPQLVWELPEGVPSRARYLFFDHVCERFVSAFADTVGAWCKENGIRLTGHVLSEETLTSQSRAVGEAMRSYRGFQLPGMDMLCDYVELTTAKQVQSAARQYGREGVMSELYGVTNWDFDFRGHKFQGDWQAALGVTVRVPHLSWVSMAGEAKRDYPASINYQSPWYREYRFVEDHFARLNTALTRGKPVASVGVLHPIESYWLHCGPMDATSDARQDLEQRFENTIEWLLFGQMDFDFISESLLPGQFGGVDDGLRVGEMRYSAVVVPGCETIRSTTLDILEKFQATGGRVIFMGGSPKYVDAAPSDRALRLAEKAVCCGFSRIELLRALEPERFLEVRNISGERADNLIYQLREDDGGYWLFLAHGRKGSVDDFHPQQVKIYLKGYFAPVCYDTQVGQTRAVAYQCRGGETEIAYTFYAQDSLLLRLEPGEEGARCEDVCTSEACGETAVTMMNSAVFSLSEPNVVLLDMARFSWDGGPLSEKEEEILRIDGICREKAGYPEVHEEIMQPWVIAEESATHTLRLSFTICSEVEVEHPVLAAERVQECRIMLDGQSVAAEATGYYVDESIHTVSLPRMSAGVHTLELELPFTQRKGCESCYLLGEFGVKVNGAQKTLTALPQTLGFSSITAQGLPFYGGNVLYEMEVEAPKCCDMTVRVSRYRGACMKVLVDGKDAGMIAYAPFAVRVPNVSEGRHAITLVLYGNRYNTMGALHNIDPNDLWFGPTYWYSRGDAWDYGYHLHETGILSCPVVEFHTQQ